MLKDPLSFDEITVGTKYEAPPGVLMIKASQPVAVFATIMGVECLVDTGTDVRLRRQGISEVWCEAVGDTSPRVYLYIPTSLPIYTTGEVFTNLDRQPIVSGHVAELQAQMRMFKLEQRQVVAEGRKQLAQHRAKMNGKTEPEPEPALEPEPEPAPAPEGEV